MSKIEFKYVFPLLFLGLFVFSLGLFNHFIWLDKIYIQFNPKLVPFDIGRLFTLQGFTGGSFYRPITATYYSAILNLFGPTAFVFKIIQLFVHLTNTLLIFVLLQKYMKKQIAFVMSMIFLVHPMNVVSVSYISAVGGVLYVLFGILALLIAHQKKMNSFLKFSLIFLFLLLSVLSKEDGITFYFLTLAYFFIFDKKNLFFSFTSSIMAGIFYLFLRLGIAHIDYTRFEIVPIMRLNIIQRLFHIPQIIIYYLKTFFFPYHLATNQQWTIHSISISNFYLPLISIIFLLVILSYFLTSIRKEHQERSSHFVFFLLWFSLGLSIYLQIIPLDYTVANRWFYSPMVGLLGMIGVTLSTVSIRIHQKYVTIIAIVLISTLSLRAFIRTTNWHDEAILFGHDSQITTNFDTEDQLAVALYFKGKPDEALIHAKRSVSMFPYDGNLLHLAEIYEGLNDVENAKQSYLLAAQADNYAPGNHERVIYRLLARFLIKHDAVAARKVIDAGIKEYPDSYRLWALDAINEYRLGNREEALASAFNAMQVNSNSSTTHLVSDIINNENIQFTDEFIQ